MALIHQHLLSVISISFNEAARKLKIGFGWKYKHNFGNDLELILMTRIGEFSPSLLLQLAIYLNSLDFLLKYKLPRRL